MEATGDIRTQAQALLAAVPFVERVEEIDGRLTSIEAEQKALRGLLPRSDVGERLAVWLRASRERFEQRDASVLVHQLSAGEAPWVPQNGEALFALLVFILGPDLEETAREAVARLAYPEGASLQERRERGAALQAERSRLVEERAGLVDQAQAAGAAVEHLPETVRERRRAAEARQRAEQEQARQEQELASVNARHEVERRPRVGRSKQLAAIAPRALPEI